MESLADRVNKRMRELGWLHPHRDEVNISKLASEARVPYATTHGIVRGGSMPETETLSKLAAALKVSTDWLLGEVSVESPDYRRGWSEALRAVREATDALDERGPEGPEGAPRDPLPTDPTRDGGRDRTGSEG